MGRICFPLDLSSIQLTHGYWDPSQVLRLGCAPAGAWPWVGSEEVPCSCGFTVVSCPDLKGLNRDVLNSSFFTTFGFSQNLGVQALFLILGKQGNLWSPMAKSIPLDKTYSITTADMLHGDAPHSLTLWGTLRRSFFLSVSGSLCLKFSKLNMLYAIVLDHLTPCLHETC